MKFEIISKSGICFKVELTEYERKNIKKDFVENLDEIYKKTNNRDTDRLLEEIKDLL